LETNPGIRRRYDGPIDLLRPTFYVSPALGDHPARLARELIGGDARFFEPQDDRPRRAADESGAAARGGASRGGASTGGKSTRSASTGGDHNYNANRSLSEAIAAGARGAYWDILRRLRCGG
jgi:hypothetical protein